ncbi:MAG: tetratricopeptide repeat protein [Magnetospirillum sp.]
MPASEHVERFHAEHARLMGYAALINGRHDQASQWFERLCRRHDSAEGWLHWGIAQLRQGKTDEAQESFRHCRTLEAPPWSDLARQAENRPADEVQAHFPAMFANSVYELAMEHFRRQEYAQCLAILTTFTDDHGEMANILCLSAQVCLTLKRPQQALALAKRSAELMPSMARYHSIVATAALATGRVELALERARAGLAMQPDLHYAASTLATVLIHAGEFQEATQVIDTALDTHPGDPVLLRQRQLIENMKRDAQPPHVPQQRSPS